MKLHLPIGLRAALLAVLSYASLPAVQAASGDGAVYYQWNNQTLSMVGSQSVTGDGTLNTKDFDFYNIDYSPAAFDGTTNTYRDDPRNYAANPTIAAGPINAKNTSWIMDISATNLSRGNLGGDYTESCVVLANSVTQMREVEWEDWSDKWWNNNTDEWEPREERVNVLEFEKGKDGQGLFISNDGAICVISHPRRNFRKYGATRTPSRNRK